MRCLHEYIKYANDKPVFLQNRLNYFVIYKNIISSIDMYNGYTRDVKIDNKKFFNKSQKAELITNEREIHNINSVLFEFNREFFNHIYNIDTSPNRNQSIIYDELPRGLDYNNYIGGLRVEWVTEETAYSPSGHYVTLPNEARIYYADDDIPF